MNRDYRLQHNDDPRWRRVKLDNVERLANWDKLVWQVAWILINHEYGRVSDLKQLESVIKPERQITLLGIEGTRIKARWSNRTTVTIEDMEFVDKSHMEEVRRNEEGEQAYVAQAQVNMVPLAQNVGVQQVQMQCIPIPMPQMQYPAPPPPAVNVIDNGQALHVFGNVAVDAAPDENDWQLIPPVPRR